MTRTIVLLLTCLLQLVASAQSASTRPFRMGLTRLPAEASIEGLLQAQTFAHSHGDIVSVAFNSGIPWPEALAGKPFSKDVESSLKYVPPQGMKLFLTISAINREHKGLAPYWGEQDSRPLPAPWNTHALDSPEVRKAFARFVQRAIREMRPDYLSLGSDANALLSNDPTQWSQWKALYRETYQVVKKAHPSLPVFFTVDVLHYLRLADKSSDKDQRGEVADLMKQSDVFAMSLYPHLHHAVPRPLPEDFLDFASSYRKPVAMAETGMTSRDIALETLPITLHGSEADQRQYLETLFTIARRDRYLFVINQAPTDFEKLCAVLPAPANDLFRIWAYTGLQSSAGKPKPALSVWDAQLKIRYAR